MKLPAVVESLDKIEEAYRGAYVEQAGVGFVLDADIESHPQVAGLKNTVKSVRGERDAVAQALKVFKDLGMTPEDIAEAKAAREAASTAGTAGGGGGTPAPVDAEKLRRKLEADVRKDMEPVVRERDELKAALDKHQLYDVADAAALKAGVLPERLEDARNAYTRFVRLNAEKRVEVLDRDGDATGEGLDRFFTERFKDMKPWFYAGSGATGGGASGSSGSVGGSGIVTLTREQAGDAKTYTEALKKVGGDFTRIKVATG
jgi:hypothetical protein